MQELKYNRNKKNVFVSLPSYRWWLHHEDVITWVTSPVVIQPFIMSYWAIMSGLVVRLALCMGQNASDQGHGGRLQQQTVIQYWIYMFGQRLGY